MKIKINKTIVRVKMKLLKSVGQWVAQVVAKGGQFE